MFQDDPIVLKLNKFEYGVIYHALNEKRNHMISNCQSTESLDDVLLKIIQINEKRNLKSEKTR